MPLLRNFLGLAAALLKDRVKLGRVDAYDAGVAINDDLPVGDFGVDVLEQFRFQIEPSRRQVEFEPLFQGTASRSRSSR